jgi:haloacid dehalogenase superfamily, subfamily IA, variant 1 with third motif having Dx(3-4)D or Dx(3-4)E
VNKAIRAVQFGKLRSLTRPNPSARVAIQTAFDMGCDVVIATNPIFPETAIRQRMKWAGVSDFPFKLITSYEVMHSAKPNSRYYSEILERIGRSPDECIMVGDDWGNDIVPATKARLQVFWVNTMTDSMNGLDPSARWTLAEFKDRFLRLHKQEVFSNYPDGLLYDLSAPLHLGIEHSAAQSQCYAIPNDDRHQPLQNSIDQPEGDTDVKKQTEGQAYLMGALEFEKPPYLWDHSHCR